MQELARKAKKPKADAARVSSARALAGENGDRKRKREGGENGDATATARVATERSNRRPGARAGEPAMSRTSARPGARVGEPATLRTSARADSRVDVL